MRVPGGPFVVREQYMAAVSLQPLHQAVGDMVRAVAREEVADGAVEVEEGVLGAADQILELFG
ncbi:hypothetical protein [Streptomyces sp. NPDC002133]|uniref:hypothetical protein n=1 Tax=Streptomyces sp. NPDC002133 TaxID=3154409 RepID=UPI00332EA2F5